MNKTKVVKEVNHNIWCDFVSYCKKGGKTVGCVLGEILNRVIIKPASFIAKPIIGGNTKMIKDIDDAVWNDFVAFCKKNNVKVGSTLNAIISKELNTKKEV